MQRLRGADGCPWDREQTLATLRPFVLEETYEVLDAIDRQDYDDLRGEIGDFLFEGVFLAQIAHDDGRFSVADSLRAITAKLIRRHPHVFGTTKRRHHRRQGRRAMGTDQVARTGRRRPTAVGAPRHAEGAPSLLGAHEISPVLRRSGFDWARAEDVLAKIEEEVAELKEAVGGEGPAGSKKRWAICSSR